MNHPHGTVSLEDQLLLIGTGSIESVKQYVSDDPDWKRLLRRALAHKLLPRLGRVLEESGAVIPESVREEIKAKSFLEMAAGTSPFPEYTFAQQAYAKMTLEHIKKYNPSFDNETLVSPKQAVRTDQYKFIKYGTGLEELFNIESDKGETKNVIGDNREIADKMKSRLEKMSVLNEGGGDQSDRLSDFDPEIIRRLEDLGYI